STGLIGLTPSAILWHAGDINSLRISGGTGGNIFRVTGAPTASAQNTINGGSGNDSFLMEFATGTFALNGQGGNDTLTVDDSGYSNVYTYTLDYNTFSRTGLAITSDPIENIVVDGSDGADTYKITATGTGGLNIHGGSGS